MVVQLSPPCGFLVLILSGAVDSTLETFKVLQLPEQTGHLRYTALHPPWCLREPAAQDRLAQGCLGPTAHLGICDEEAKQGRRAEPSSSGGKQEVGEGLSLQHCPPNTRGCNVDQSIDGGISSPAPP